MLEKAAGTTVVDRTELIIRIFEAHARDAASRLEVELADLEYRLPRVKGRNPELSRLGGGTVLARGPGEQQLEYDRRAIRRRMETINRKLEEEKAARAVRGARLKNEGPPPSRSLGYTNAGKTTILNALSGAGRSTKDRLFETLETTTRLVEGTSARWADGARPDFVVTDTVGFIRKLPDAARPLLRLYPRGRWRRGREGAVRRRPVAELEDEMPTVRRTLARRWPAPTAPQEETYDPVPEQDGSRLWGAGRGAAQGVLRGRHDKRHRELRGAFWRGSTTPYPPSVSAWRSLSRTPSTPRRAGSTASQRYTPRRTHLPGCGWT